MSTVIEAPLNCNECIFVEHIDKVGRTCRFQTKYKGKSIPAFTPSNKKPEFCKIQKIIVYEEE
jgi:superfamily II DNA/RNA helicase